MEDERSQHIQGTLEALSSRQSTFPSIEGHSPDNVTNDLRADPYRPPHSAAPTFGLTPSNDAMPSPRYRSSHHPHRATRVMGVTELPRIEQPPNPPPPSWSREPDAESQTDTVVGEGRGGTLNRLSRIFAGRLTFWQRLRGEGRRYIGWGESLKNMATFSCTPSSLFRSISTVLKLPCFILPQG
jgi:hypothetical protein